MASTGAIISQYVNFIGNEVVNKFGGSYQTYESMGRLWRQKMDYDPKVEEFAVLQSKLFLRLLDIRDQGNFNMMYKVCYNIAEYLSKYIVKKSPELTRAKVTDTLLDELFLHSDRFVAKFNKAYKRPIDMSDARYMASNPGVIAMYKAIHGMQH